MINFGVIESTTRPNEIERDDLSVWLNTDITEVGTEEDKRYAYNQIQYTKKEYDILTGMIEELTTDEKLEELAMSFLETQKQLETSQEVLDFVLMGGM